MSNRHGITTCGFILALMLGIAGLFPETTHAQSISREDPGVFVLTAAYPNPFNPTTSFSVTVRDEQVVTVEIYNMLGQRVAHLFTGRMEAGETRSFLFDAFDLPSGIYLYQVRGSSFSATRQVTLFK